MSPHRARIWVRDVAHITPEPNPCQNGLQVTFWPNSGKPPPLALQPCRGEPRTELHRHARALIWICARTQMLPGPSLSPEERARSFAGEPQGPAPPFALLRSDPAPIHHSVASGGLRILRRCLPTQPSFESAPGRPSSVFASAAPPREHAAGAASAAARAPNRLWPPDLGSTA